MYGYIRYLMAGGFAMALALIVPDSMPAPGRLISAAVAQEKARDGKAGNKVRKNRGEKGKREETEHPTEVTADSMEILEEKNLVIFTGNVKAVRGDTTLLAERLEVRTEKTKDEKGEEGTRMREWIATGNVRIIQPETTITGQKAIMDTQNEILTVEGDVTVEKPDATLKGHRLMVNLRTKTTQMLSTGKKERVRGIFR